MSLCRNFSQRRLWTGVWWRRSRPALFGCADPGEAWRSSDKQNFKTLSNIILGENEEGKGDSWIDTPFCLKAPSTLFLLLFRIFLRIFFLLVYNCTPYSDITLILTPLLPRPLLCRPPVFYPTAYYIRVSRKHDNLSVARFQLHAQFSTWIDLHWLSIPLLPSTCHLLATT